MKTSALPVAAMQHHQRRGRVTKLGELEKLGEILNHPKSKHSGVTEPKALKSGSKV
ncbi:MAG: hypothetical protein KJO36_11920 [Acidimicrobiia bacterium]|nr:hypothetical protein [Acidimicrobiia bacterium]MBT8249817.1 hypothetical protein [Acidimicrobiia bacterium]NNL27987.1 hypothetical protein [Acidimicrobiia bacterium]